VILEVTGTSKSFEAYFTLERAITSMHSRVDYEATRTGEQFIAYITFQSFFCIHLRMRLLMILAVTGAGESLKTNITFKWTITSVRAVMDS
jgi:hypothetical protein